MTLPIFLDSLVTAWGAILISVTLILLFGEIIPQSVCSRHGLAIGAAVAPFVRVLVWICFPVAYPTSKLLDFLLGHGHVALFRRVELKTLVDLHGNELMLEKVEKLTRDETTIIAGALGFTEKTASDAMTPISDTFAIDINAKLDRELMNLILEKGHRRVPVYYEQPTNIIGLVLDRRSQDNVSIVIADLGRTNWQSLPRNSRDKWKKCIGDEDGEAGLQVNKTQIPNVIAEMHDIA
ncbi:unnamed protein product [Camellia sinensis]